MVRGIYSKLWPNRSGSLGLVLCLGLLCYGGLAQAAMLNVPGSYPTIQSAIDVAGNGDTVLVADGTYVENINFNGRAITVRSESGAASAIIDGAQSGSVVTFNSAEGSGSVLDGFTITNGSGTYDGTEGNDGGGIYCRASSPTIINCFVTGNTANAGSGGGIYCSSSSSPTITSCVISNNMATWGGGVMCLSSSPTITDCTISDNTAMSFGGGIDCEWSASPTIENCTIRDNTVTSSGGGGGIDCSTSSSPSINNCTIMGNTANHGGGISCWYDSSPHITNCIISSNTANRGGGIYCSDAYFPGNGNSSSPVITNCKLSGNTAEYEGGGIGCYKSSPSISNCTISGNTAKWGGGIRCGVSSSPKITNCVLSGNVANSSGGGIGCSFSSSPTIVNCTIGGNTATYFGGGISCKESSSSTVINSILWWNSADSSPNEIYLDGTGTINVSYSNIWGGWSGTGNININPLFFDSRPASEAPTLAGNYHLKSSSPCIDAGTATDAPTDDIDSDARPYDVPSIPNNPSAYDMGADEYTSLINYDISLSSSWNLISLPLQPSNTAIESVLNAISGKYESVWAFIGGTWKVYDPQNPGFSDLATMEAGWGYWIKMTEAATLNVSGSISSDSIDLVSGWNLVGYNSTNSQAVADALTSIDGKYVSVWAFIDGGWKVYDPANPGFSDLTTVEPTYGYWINTSQECAWSLDFFHAEGRHIVSDYTGKKFVFRGVNLTGLEFGSFGNNPYPGDEGTNYFKPRPEDLDNIKALGFNVIRVPFEWARLVTHWQPTDSLPTSLNPNYLAILNEVVQMAGDRKLYVIFDMHDFLKYWSGQSAQECVDINSDDDYPKLLARTWKLLAEYFSGNTTVLGYDIMNEPVRLEDGEVCGSCGWHAIAQSVVNEIRTVDDRHLIFVEGPNYSLASYWPVENSKETFITDTVTPPRIVYSPHVFFDFNNDSRYDQVGEESAPIGLWKYYVRDRLMPVIDWSIDNNVPIFIGETNVPCTAGWAEVLDYAFTDFFEPLHLSVTAWHYINPQHCYEENQEVPCFLNLLDCSAEHQLNVLKKYPGGAYQATTEPVTFDSLIYSKARINPWDSGQGYWGDLSISFCTPDPVIEENCTISVDFQNNYAGIKFMHHYGLDTRRLTHLSFRIFLTGQGQQNFKIFTTAARSDCEKIENPQGKDPEYPPDNERPNLRDFLSLSVDSGSWYQVEIPLQRIVNPDEPIINGIAFQNMGEEQEVFYLDDIHLANP